MVGSLFNPLGNAAGSVVPSLLVSCVLGATAAAATGGGGGGGAVGTGAACPSRAEVHGMEELLLSQAVLATASSLWALTCFRGQPRTPPSQSQAIRCAVSSATVALPCCAMLLTPPSTVLMRRASALSTNDIAVSASRRAAAAQQETKDVVAEIKAHARMMLGDSEFRKLLIGFVSAAHRCLLL